MGIIVHDMIFIIEQNYKFSLPLPPLPPNKLSPSDHDALTLAIAKTDENISKGENDSDESDDLEGGADVEMYGGTATGGAANGAKNGLNEKNDKHARMTFKIDESRYESWTQKEVLLWLKMNLIKNGFESLIVNSFLKEFSTKYVTGRVLKEFKNNESLIDNMMSQFSDKNQAFGVWTVIRANIDALGQPNATAGNLDNEYVL